MVRMYLCAGAFPNWRHTNWDVGWRVRVRVRLSSKGFEHRVLPAIADICRRARCSVNTSCKVLCNTYVSVTAIKISLDSMFLRRRSLKLQKTLIIGTQSNFQILLFIVMSGMTNSIVNKYFNNSMILSQWEKPELVQAGFSEKTPQWFWRCGAVAPCLLCKDHSLPYEVIHVFMIKGLLIGFGMHHLVSRPTHILLPSI